MVRPTKCSVHTIFHPREHLAMPATCNLHSARLSVRVGTADSDHQHLLMRLFYLVD